MVTLDFFLFFMVLVFALIGSMRGWAKELLVSFAVVLAIFIVSIVEDLAPNLVTEFTRAGTTAYFWVRTVLVIVLVFFGYQTPNLPKLGGARFARERLQDILLGAVLGGFNGFLIVGSLWYFMHTAGYPFQPKIIPPIDDGITKSAFTIITWISSNWISGPLLYVTVALAFLFVLVVLI